MKKKYRHILLLLLISCSAPSHVSDLGSDSHIWLDVVEDTQARQLYINGFEKLSLREKALAYYLTQAGLAGRDIYYDQNHRHALALRQICEEILIHARGLNSELLRKIRAYTHRIWFNSCNYYHSSKKKFIPEFSANEFEIACASAMNNSAELSLPAGYSIKQYLDSLHHHIFDPGHQPMITIKNSNDSLDIIANSANNFYQNLTLQDVHDWLKQGLEQHPSNSKLVKQDSQIVELVYRTGLPDSGISSGLYAEQLQEVIHNLRLAQQYSDSLQRQIIDDMILFYQTGRPKYASSAFKLWLHSSPRVDFLQGFIEVYTDPLGRKGSFQSIVYFEDERRTELMQRMVDNTEYFEKNAPYAEKYKRTEFKSKPEVIAALVISGAGDGAPITPAGINLPNDQKFREQFGAKNLIFTNILGISGGNEQEYDPEYSRRYVYEFFHPADIKALRHQNYEDATFAMVCLHELIGHGSGKVNPDLSGDPADHLKEYYSTLEEARAELMALWFIQDPKLYYIGMIKNRHAADEVYRRWARNDLLMLTRMEHRNTIEQDHERARHLIVSYLRDFGAISMVKIKGKIYTRVTSTEKFRAGVGKLLREVMRIKGEGDYTAARELVQKYGVYFNLQWRDQILRRHREITGKRANIRYTGYSMPILLPEFDKSGAIKNVRVKYLKDFEKEQLYYSGKIELE